jgi:protein TonB
MLNTKLNLYNPDWIELVFTNRNKSYGAFELRQHYSSTMLKAMGIGFTTVLAAALLYNVSLRHVIEAPVTLFTERVIKLKELKIEKPVEPKLAPSKPQPPVTTQKLTSFVVTTQPVSEEPPKISQLTGAIGPATVKGDDTAPVENVVAPSTGPGSSPAPVVDESIHSTGSLETMPEPVGGAAAWSKFLNRNLRFPAEAQDAGKGGRVIVSFVIEKDGRLSDITVTNGAGYGMDEEALRVLKLAKPWKPGIQNGNPVRVRYTIPMNFQLSE